MRTARRARIAVVGLGRMGRVHARNLAAGVRTAELAAVVDSVESQAREFGELHGVRWSTSLDAVLGDPALALDGVVVATPSRTHPELVERAAATGRHVFCEKPLGLHFDACAGAVAAADAAAVSLQVGFHRRFDPDWQALEAAVRAGTLGRLDLFRCSHRNASAPDDADLGDVFADMAVHDLDAARWVAGEVADVRAAVRSDEPGAAVVTLAFESGALGAIDLHRRVGYGFECSAEAVCSEATARCGDTARRAGPEVLCGGLARRPLARDHEEHHAAAYVRELEHFGEVATGRAVPRVGGEDALRALELAREAARSVASSAGVT